MCINDGSTDASGEILESIAHKDKRVIVLNQKNQGQSIARNNGLDRAKGKYISFIDSDDYVEGNMLEKLVDRAEITNADIVITNILLYLEDTNSTKSFRDEVLYYKLRDKVFTISEVPEMIRNIGVWDRIYRREFIQQNSLRFPENLVYEDHFFCIESELLASKIAVIPEHLYYYRKNAGESITDREKLNDHFKKDFLTIHKKIQKSLHKSAATVALKREYFKYFLANAFMHQSNATNFKFFVCFFKEVQLIVKNNLDYIDLCDCNYLQDYVRYLLRNEVIRCYWKIHI